MIVGVLLLVVGVFADSFGLGTTARFGWKQIAASVAGVVVVVAGAWLATRKAA